MGNQQAIPDRAAVPYRHLLTVEDFLILDQAGAFEGLGRVELIEGEIYVMAPLYFPHGRILLVLTTAVDLAVQSLGMSLQALTPVSARLTDTSLPEPDLMVVAAAAAHEGVVLPEMVRLFIEVADTSLAYDLGRKLRLYARSGVPEYWVADVNGREIIRFHVPAGERYAERTSFAFGEAVSSATIAGLTVDTSRLAG